MKKKFSYKEKINLLINELKNKDCNYYLLPRTDKFQNEFILEEDERIKWLTGFTGSYAFVIISIKETIIFTDGRYINQIQKELDANLFRIFNIRLKNPIIWLEENIKRNEKIILDSWLFTSRNYNFFKNLIEKKGSKIVISESILLDNIWKKKNKQKKNNYTIRKIKYSGVSFQRKFSIINKLFKKKKIENFFFCSPESISWLLNIRSNEIKYTPTVQSFLLFSLNYINLFFIKKNSKKIEKFFNNYLKISQFNNLKNILINFAVCNREIYLDPSKTPYFIDNFLQKIGVKVFYEQDPCNYLKCIKNSVEINGMRNSHIRDGVSICKFLFWLDKSINKNQKVSEIIASKKINCFKKDNYLYKGPSFETISAFGSNSSIIHYRVTNESNKILKKNNLYLLDTGTQYVDGTTDITRTVTLGNKPLLEQQDRFTRVLKGNLSLNNTYFTYNTTGMILDKIARRYLKKEKLDYDHGTGHGVGSYLSVHEGPISISKLSKTKFKEGMILTNEPGFYKEEKYGIRIENMILVVKKNNLLTFETLTLVPIDKKLINEKLLTNKEKNWLNIYHKKVFDKIYRYLTYEEKIWLKDATNPI